MFVRLIEGLLKDGHELISRALTLFSSVCGVLHEDVCMCMRLLGRISYILGDSADVNMHYSSFMSCCCCTYLNCHPQNIQSLKSMFAVTCVCLTGSQPPGKGSFVYRESTRYRPSTDHTGLCEFHYAFINPQTHQYVTPLFIIFICKYISYL